LLKVLICECIKFREYKIFWLNLDEPTSSTLSKVESLAVDAWSLVYGVKFCGGLSWILLHYKAITWSFHVGLQCIEKDELSQTKGCHTPTLVIFNTFDLFIYYNYWEGSTADTQ